jgi:hypothetical protein
MMAARMLYAGVLKLLNVYTTTVEPAQSCAQLAHGSRFLGAGNLDRRHTGVQCARQFRRWWMKCDRETFVFYDWMQVEIGSCTWDDVATIVACPVVAIHPERNDVILYGGAVHLSKESLRRVDGSPSFGAIVYLEEGGWSAPISWRLGAFHSHRSMASSMPMTPRLPRLVQRVRVGGLLGIVPIHSCLTADLLKRYLTLDGAWLAMAPIPHSARRSDDSRTWKEHCCALEDISI